MPPFAESAARRPGRSGVQPEAVHRLINSPPAVHRLEVEAKPYQRSLAVLGMLRFLDVPLVVVALVPVLAVRAPVLGYALGAGGWLLQRVIGEVDRRWTRKVATPLKQLGVTLFEGFARIWLLAGMIIIAAVVGGRRSGLTASLVILGAYSVAFAIKLIQGPPRKRVAQ